MPRTKPTINVDTLGRYDAHPAKDVAEYFISKANELWFMKPPCVDTPGEDLESFYIDGKTEYNFLQKYLAVLREEQRDQNKIFMNRTYVLQKTFGQMHVSFYNLNNFIRDSDEKKKTAIKEINDQIELQKELKTNIFAKRAIVDELKVFREELEYTTGQYRPYETVLENAVEMSQTYESVKEMLSRCDAIMFAQDEITRLDEKLFQDIEVMRKHMTDVVKQAELISMGLKNAFANMKRSYNEARSECLRWERIYSDARKALVGNNNNKSRALDGISGIYRMLCAHRDIHPIFLRHEVEKELDFIKGEVELLRDVLGEYNKRNNFSRKSVVGFVTKC